MASGKPATKPSTAFPVSLGDQWTARFAAQAEKCGLPASHIARVLLLSGIETLEAGGRIVEAGIDTDTAPDGTRCTVTKQPDGLSRVDITMPNDSPTLARLRKPADHAGVTVDLYVAAKLTQAALEVSKAKEPLTLPAGLADAFREVAAILGRDPQSWTTGFLRAMAADLADVESGLLRDEVDACGTDPDLIRLFRAYCNRRGPRLADARRAQRKAAIVGLEQCHPHPTRRRCEARFGLTAGTGLFCGLQPPGYVLRPSSRRSWR